jgi:hypothetical protein
MDVKPPIARVATDPLSLLEKVLQHTLQELGLDTARPADARGELPLEELLAKGLGGRLARIIDGGQAASFAGELAPNLATHQLLTSRNSQVAAALGACDCWGQNTSCPVCYGDGGPGWATPDEVLFNSYVGPALVASYPSTHVPPIPN